MRSAAVAPASSPPVRGGAREAILWAGAFAAAIAAHVAVGWFLLPRVAGPAGAMPDPAVVTIDMPASAASSSDMAAAPEPSQAARPSAAPEPVLEPVPDVPAATVQPLPEPATSPSVPDAPDTPAPVAIELPEPALPLPAMVPPSPAIVLPPPPKAVPRPARPNPVTRRPRERVAARPLQAADRGERRSEAGPSSPAARTAGAATAASGGASAASSSVWRSQLNAYLRARMRVPGGAGRSIGISFSVSRGGQITSARLSSSSGDATVDGAALAVFRGAVPPPPPDYTGPLAFTTNVRVQ